MEPNQNITTPAPVPTPAQSPVANKSEDIVFADKPKKSKGMIFGMIFLALLAIGGIGFGVWAWMDGNTQKDSLNSQISVLKQQNNDLQYELSNNDNISDINGSILNGDVNPIVDVQDSNYSYSLGFSSSNVWVDGSNKIVDIVLEDGNIVSCEVAEAEYLESGGIKKPDFEDCSVTGLSGDVYKIVEFGAGHDNSGDYIGFIMTDGTVKYLPLYDSVENNDFAIKGELDIDGKVVDSLTVGVRNEETGWGGTVFILDDGTVLEYDKSML